MPKSPLYFSGITNDGRPLLAGAFRMKDEVGFPVDMTYELAREQGWAVDWCEALADAGRQKQSKLMPVLREISYLLGEEAANEIGRRFTLLVTGLPCTHFQTACEVIMRMKHESLAPNH